MEPGVSVRARCGTKACLSSFFSIRTETKNESTAPTICFLSVHNITELIQGDILVAQGLDPSKIKMTVDVWERYLDEHPDLRVCLRVQTGWSKKKDAKNLAGIYGTLSGWVHGQYQEGTGALTIPDKALTPEQCFAVACVLKEMCYPFEFAREEMGKRFLERQEKSGRRRKNGKYNDQD